MDDKLMLAFKKNPAGEEFLNELLAILKEIRQMQAKFEQTLEKQLGAVEKNALNLSKAINEPAKEETPKPTIQKPKLSAREFFMQDYVQNKSVWHEKFSDITGDTPEAVWKHLFAKHRAELGSFIQVRVKN